MDKRRVIKSAAEQVVAPLHSKLVSTRRTKTLANLLCSYLEQSLALKGLDIGCGTGEISRLIMDARPGVSMTGVDVLVRDDTFIPVTHFDGQCLPFGDNSFDFAIIVDVLHHTLDATVILKEAARVSKSFVLLKDHYCQSAFDKTVLSFMDWVGNRAHDVSLPYNYLSASQWQSVYDQCQLVTLAEIDQLGLYPPPFDLLFDRHLHFVAKLGASNSPGINDQIGS